MAEITTNSLKPVITDAALQAASSLTDGFQIKITHIALGDAYYTPTRGRIGLDGEKQRVQINSSEVTGSNGDQVHVSATIENENVDGAILTEGYWVREIGFYGEHPQTGESVLLAVYSEDNANKAIAYKSPETVLLLGFDLRLDAFPENSITVDSKGDLLLNQATETAAGVVELATHAEIALGEDDQRAVTPVGLHVSMIPVNDRLSDLEGASHDSHSLDSPDRSMIDAVYVNNSGDVGIGTTTPGYQLDVAGTVHIENKLTVDGDLEVKGTTTHHNVEQHHGDVNLGDADTDVVSVHGLIQSTHSSGTLQLDDQVDISQGLYVKNGISTDSDLNVSNDANLGDADTDVVSVHGLIQSTHSSGTLQLDDQVEISQGLYVKNGIGTDSDLNVGNNANLGDADTDVVSVHGLIQSTHSSGMLQIDDQVDISQGLNVAGTVHIENKLTVDGDLEVKGTTTHHNVEQHYGDVNLGDADTDVVSVHGLIQSTHSSGTLQIDDDVTIQQGLNVNQNISVRGSVEIDGNVILGNGDDNQVKVKGRLVSTHTDGYLHMDSATFLGNEDGDHAVFHGELRSSHSSGKLEINDTVHISENLDVEGAADFNSSIDVKGEFTADQQASFNHYVNFAEPIRSTHVSGEVEFNAGVHVTEKLRVDGDIEVNKQLLFQGSEDYSTIYLDEVENNLNRLIFNVGDDTNDFFTFRVTPHNSNPKDIMDIKYGSVSIHDASLMVGGDIDGRSAHMTEDLKVDGRIGVGNSNPQYALDVTGKLRVTTDATVEEELHVFRGAYFATTLGSVGIGTASPDSKLHVQGKAHVTEKLTIDGDLEVNGAASHLRGSLQVDNDLGVGIASPATKLHVSGIDNGVSYPLMNDKDYRPSIAVTGLFPEINLFSYSDNSNHGSTLRFGGFNDETHNTYRHWVVGTSGSNCRFLDFGFAENSDNPHVGIRNHPGGTTIMTMLENGNVGVGIIEPNDTLDVQGTVHIAEKLTVDGDIKVNKQLLFQGSEDYSTIYLDEVENNLNRLIFNVGDDTNDFFTFRVTPHNSNPKDIMDIKYGSVSIHDASLMVGGDIDGRSAHMTEDLRVDNKIGVGIASPATNLHVSGIDSDVSYPLTIDKDFRPTIAVTGYYPEINLFSNGVNEKHGSTLRFGGFNDSSHSAHKHWVIGTSGSNCRFLDFGFGNNADNSHVGIRNHGDGKTIMTMLENGNVGIGFTEPNATLDVNGTVHINDKLTIDGRIGVGNSNPAYALDVTGQLRVTTDAIVEQELHVFGKAYFAATQGSVGIGTASPDAKLQVQGTVHVTEKLTIDGDLEVKGAASHLRGSLQVDNNLGVGIASPATKLHVNGIDNGVSYPLMDDKDYRPSIAVTGLFPEINLFSYEGNSNHGSTLRFGGFNDSTHNTYKHWVVGTSGSDCRFLDFGFANNADNPHVGIRNHAGGKTIMTLKEGGEVGLNVLEPQAQLHVNSGDPLDVTDYPFQEDGEERARIAVTGNYPEINLFANYNSNTNHGATLRFGGFNNGSHTDYKHWVIGTPAKNARFLDFGFAENFANPHSGIRNSNGKTVMTMLESGNVGIGTLEPSSTLDVQGTANIDKELTVGGRLTMEGSGSATGSFGVGSVADDDGSGISRSSFNVGGFMILDARGATTEIIMEIGWIPFGQLIVTAHHTNPNSQSRREYYDITRTGVNYLRGYNGGVSHPSITVTKSPDTNPHPIRLTISAVNSGGGTDNVTLVVSYQGHTA